MLGGPALLRPCSDCCGEGHERDELLNSDDVETGERFERGDRYFESPDKTYYILTNTIKLSLDDIITEAYVIYHV